MEFNDNNYHFQWVIAKVRYERSKIWIDYSLFGSFLIAYIRFPPVHRGIDSFTYHSIFDVFLRSNVGNLTFFWRELMKIKKP